MDEFNWNCVSVELFYVHWLEDFIYLLQNLLLCHLFSPIHCKFLRKLNVLPSSSRLRHTGVGKSSESLVMSSYTDALVWIY